MTKVIPLQIKLALLFCVTMWASAFVGIRAGLLGYSPGGLALLRFLIASVCMFFIYLRFAKKDPIPLRDKIKLLMVGVIGIGGYNIALNYGELSVQSGVASFVISQSPIVTLILAVIFLKEHFKKIGIIGMAISVFGVFLISMGHTSGFTFDKGFMFILVAMLIGGLYSVLQKPFLKHYHPIDVTTYIIYGGALSLVVFTPDLIRDLHHTSLSATLAVIYLAVFPASLGYVAWAYVLMHISASRAVSFLYFMPIIATILGWIWLGEIPAVLSIVGGLIALFGVWVVNSSYRKIQIIEPST